MLFLSQKKGRGGGGEEELLSRVKHFYRYGITILYTYNALCICVRVHMCEYDFAHFYNIAIYGA